MVVGGGAPGGHHPCLSLSNERVWNLKSSFCRCLQPLTTPSGVVGLGNLVPETRGVRQGGPHPSPPARHRLPIGIKGILPRVMRIGTTEVIFLDRCGTRGSEGALLDRIRQSRTRVWGSKMIRYRRSPLTVNRASSVSVGCSAMGEARMRTRVNARAVRLCVRTTRSWGPPY